MAENAKRKSENLNFQNVTVKTRTTVINGVTQKSSSPKIVKMETYSITEVCPHDIAEIRVIESVATCETTVLVCIECGEQLTQPKTEC